MSGSGAEARSDVKNGTTRLIVTLIAIAVEVAIIIVLYVKLSNYAEWIAVATRIAAILLVLFIFSGPETPSLKMPWIVLIVAFPVVGVVMYVLVGVNLPRHKMVKRYQEIDKDLMPQLGDCASALQALESQDPQGASVARYLHEAAGFPLCNDGSIEYYDDASDGFEAQLEALARARDFIFMDYHAIELGTSFRRMLDVLVDRVEAGVEVRLFYDDMGSIGFINKDFVGRMEELGIRCRVFNPFGPGLNIFLDNRDHRKITVIDGVVGFTGGYNLADEYFNLTHPYGMWKDTGVKVTGHAVRSLTALFLEMWDAADPEGKMSDYGRYLRAPKTPSTGAFIQPYGDNPLDDESTGENVYIALASQAVDRCWFITPYLILTDEMIRTLTLAAKRGVDVRIITPGIPDKKMVYSITRSYYSVLASKGVRIFEWTPGFCHAKMCMVDGRIATCGTINLDFRSLYHHFENGCLFAGCDAVADVERDFIATFEQCKEVTEHYASGKGARLNIMQLLLRLFAALM